jgi:hypothetical protein
MDPQIFYQFEKMTIFPAGAVLQVKRTQDPKIFEITLNGKIFTTLIVE